MVKSKLSYFFSFSDLSLKTALSWLANIYFVLRLVTNESYSSIKVIEKNESMFIMAGLLAVQFLCML